MSPKKGTVYLVHFHQKYRHCGHYLGWSSNVDEREVRHKKGNGARLLQVLNENGIGYHVVRTWANATRELERKLKRQKNSWRLCPICNPGGNSKWIKGQ